MTDKCKNKWKNWIRGSAVAAFVLLGAMILLHTAFLPQVAFATSPTSIAVQVPLGPYPGVVSAGNLAITFTTADTTNGNSFPMSAHEVLVISNPDTAAHTITINSVADAQGRTMDITSYSVPAGTYAAFNFRGGTGGWLQPSDQTVHFQANSALVQFAVLRIP